MAMQILGSERYTSRPIDPAEFVRELPETLELHTTPPEASDALDPLTYEVVRHRLWSVTDEMGETLKRMSGSTIVTDANDFDFAISDELGQEVQVGLYNTMLVGAVDLAIYWVLKNRKVREGDMFLCNDPWIGGGLHQNDVIVFQPIFHEGKLFAWTSAVCHEIDLGGVGIGSFSPAAQDVFSEAVPTPPVKVVRDFELQDDVADLWVRRSRVPLLVGLDLRAKIGANTVARQRLLSVIEQYGADTVKAVMKRMMSDAESRLRTRLNSLPDGTWSATGYQDQAFTGDRGVYKITVAMTKKGGHLTFDFTGTDKQAGLINCAYGGMRGGVMLALLPILAHDIPWSAGGLMRCFDLVSEEGTITNATFPAALSRAPIGPAWLTGSLVGECLAQMLDRSDDLIDNVRANCCGTHDTAILAGMDPGGLACIPMGRIPDVEMNEYAYPLLTLWRKEEPDSGGPGRHRGGLSGSVAIMPYGTEVPVGLVVASSGKAVSQNNGIAGGYPGNTAIGIIARGAAVGNTFSDGYVPDSLASLGGEHELRQCYEEAVVGTDDVLYLHWQGGGGYGDPLLRDPDEVAADLSQGKVTVAGALEGYGVVLVDGQVAAAATAQHRDAERARRRDRSQETVEEAAPIVDVSAARRLDDNLVGVDRAESPVVACRHCGRTLGDADSR